MTDGSNDKTMYLYESDIDRIEKGIVSGVDLTPGLLSSVVLSRMGVDSWLDVAGQAQVSTGLYTVFKFDNHDGIPVLCVHWHDKEISRLH